jgi:hypothetical protein
LLVPFALQYQIVLVLDQIAVLLALVVVLLEEVLLVAVLLVVVLLVAGAGVDLHLPASLLEPSEPTAQGAYQLVGLFVVKDFDLGAVD